MSNYLQALQNRYELLTVPEPMNITTGPEESREVAQKIEEFLDATMQTLQLSKRALSTFFKLQYRTLHQEVAGEQPILSPTNDVDTSFWLDGIQPLVSIRSVRDDYNYQVVVFAKYALIDRTKTTLLRIYENDTLL